MRTSIMAILSSAVCFQAAVTAGDPAGPLVLTPGTAVDLALETHPALQGEKERRREVRHQIREAYATVFPQIEGQASAVRNRDPGFLNNPSYEDMVNNPQPGLDLSIFEPIPLTTYDYRISLEQAIYHFGKLGKAVKVARIYGEQVDQEILERELGIARDAVKACYDLALAQARIKVLAAERVSLERQVEQARDFLEIGTGTRLQYLQARAALASLKPRELEAQGNLRSLRVRLNEAVGRSPLDGVAVEAGVLERAVLPALPPTEELVSLSHGRPELVASSKERAVLDMRGRIERTTMLPEIKLTGSYGFRAIETDNLADTDFASWDVGLYLDWQLFDGRRTASRVRQLESQRRRNMLEEQARKAVIASDLVAAVENYNRAREAVAASLESIGEAEEAHRVATEEREWGAATMLQVLEAERTLTTARFQRLDSVHAALAALAEIQYQVGRLPLEPVRSEETR